MGGHTPPVFRSADSADYHGGSDLTLRREQYDAVARGALRVVEVGAMDVEHFNGSITDTPAELSFTRRSCHIYVYNDDAAEDLEISFDGGTTYFTIASGSARLDLPVAVESVYLNGAAGGTDYQILVVLEPIPMRGPNPVAS